ncbi:hypothetical protein IOC57_23685 [Bacillus sp. SD075]|uniref:hypothetical protein n=1 Tax=Bacillaceae TaxID=186817 RepID=UPI001A974D87|nr:hypothetical protein [Bacillus sp. SD075]MBO1000730.1 hypothetical protein [Bacillus sp. SD075]HER2162526.1 hypothetical protein [Streptococcus pyogenes]HER2169442.1 hypothetical protein [Streptococcus pyogenes]
MNKRIGKGVYLVSSAASFLCAMLIGLHSMFYPNVGRPDSEDWKWMLFYFANGLLSQYIALNFFNDQGDQKKREESN